MAKRIEEDTPILPSVVAETVIEKVNACHGTRLGSKYVAKLVHRQALLYARNSEWRKWMRARGNKGRDTLYEFMFHWLASEIRKTHPTVSKSVAEYAANGQPMVCRR